MATSISDRSSMINSPPFELEEAIKMALKKTGATKEFDLCDFLSCEGRLISLSIYLRLRDTDQSTLLKLIWEQILNRDAHKSAHKAHENSLHSLYAGKSLEECIKEAMSKLNITRETALCKYIPCEVGYLHHFTFLKMKSSNPIQLRNLIKEYILDRIPALVSPKKRNRRQPAVSFMNPLVSTPAQIASLEEVGSNFEDITGVMEAQKAFEARWPSSTTTRQADKLQSDHSKIDQLLILIEQLTCEFVKIRNTQRVMRKGIYQKDQHLKENSHLYFQLVQNQLIKKIRMRQIDFDLWDAFVELIDV